MTGGAGGGGEVDDGARWLRDAQTVRALWRVLTREASDRGRTTPANREELVAALRTARHRLRRRLLLAEGVDPRTGQPGA